MPVPIKFEFFYIRITQYFFIAVQSTIDIFVLQQFKFVSYCVGEKPMPLSVDIKID